MRFIRNVRLAALAVALVAAAMATCQGWNTKRFVAAARHADGHLLPAPRAASALVQFSADDGSTHTIQPTYVPYTTGSDVVPILYLRTRSGIDARLGTDRTLYASMWTWIETALAATLLAIYGRALLQDPLAVIGFKSWRLNRGK